MKKLMSLLLLGVLVLSGCQSNIKSTEEVKVDEKKEETGAYPIKIEHAFGETIIEKQPEKVVAISWANQDTPLALGIVPVGVSTANWGNINEKGLLSWTYEKFKELKQENPNVFDEVDGLNFEAIADAEPDVILAAYSGLTEEEYKKLSEIAPVVAYKSKPWQTLWRDQIKENSIGLGKKEEGEKLVQDLENLISEKVANAEELKGKKVAFIYVNPSDLSSFYVYLPADPRAAYLEDLGLVIPQEIIDLKEEKDSFSVSLSAEKVDILNNVDMIVTYGVDNSIIETLQKDSLFGKVTPIKNGAVAVLINGSDLTGSATPSALSIPYTIDEYINLLKEAAKNIK